MLEQLADELMSFLEHEVDEVDSSRGREFEVTVRNAFPKAYGSWYVTYRDVHLTATTNTSSARQRTEQELTPGKEVTLRISVGDQGLAASNVKVEARPRLHVAKELDPDQGAVPRLIHSYLDAFSESDAVSVVERFWSKVPIIDQGTTIAGVEEAKKKFVALEDEFKAVQKIDTRLRELKRRTELDGHYQVWREFANSVLSLFRRLAESTNKSDFSAIADFENQFSDIESPRLELERLGDDLRRRFPILD